MEITVGYTPTERTESIRLWVGAEWDYQNYKGNRAIGIRCFGLDFKREYQTSAGADFDRLLQDLFIMIVPSMTILASLYSIFKPFFYFHGSEG